MKKCALALLLLSFTFSNSWAQATDTGGGGLPFGKTHDKLWENFSKDKQSELIELNNATTKYFTGFDKKWKECYGDIKVPQSFPDIYIHFTVQRQLKVMEAKEKFDNCESRRAHQAEKKALIKEKKEERCIFQGKDKKLMKDFLRKSNSKLYLQLKFDITEDQAEKIHQFYEDLI